MDAGAAGLPGPEPPALAASVDLLALLPSAGVGRTGVFITLSIVLERMRYEGVVDIFQTVKMLRTQRPAMVQTEVRPSSSPHWRCPTSGGGASSPGGDLEAFGCGDWSVGRANWCFSLCRISTSSATEPAWSIWEASTTMQRKRRGPGRQKQRPFGRKPQRASLLSHKFPLEKVLLTPC